jgi:hypothetical protein
LQVSTLDSLSNLFKHPIPTDDSAQFDNQTACQIYLHTQYSDAVADASQRGCSRDTNEFDKQTACQIYLHTQHADSVQAGVFAEVTLTCS